MKPKTLGLFITGGIINEYLQEQKKSQTITRSTPVQPAYKEIANQLGISISSYSDLCFLLKAVERDNDKQSNNYVLLKNLEMCGLNLEKLRNIGD